MINQATPIHKIGMHGSNDIYIKREDLLPFSFGGNKVRIALEYFAHMDELGKDCLIGYGNARSNLCRVLANMSLSRGRVCHIISPADDDGMRLETNNSYMVQSCGAKLHTCSKSNVSETVQSVIDSCVADGFNPYYIYGDKFGNGFEAIPVRAYERVYQEICRQEQKMEINFDYIFLATGTGMTQSGLLAGANLRNDKRNIVGISVARNQAREKEIILKYLNAFAYDKGIEFAVVNDITVCDDYLYGGYGKFQEGIQDTIRTIFCEKGIPLDPTYTGKAFYGMKEYIQKHRLENKKILFIHTGGVPLFFDNISLIQK